MTVHTYQRSTGRLSGSLISLLTLLMFIPASDVHADQFAKHNNAGNKLLKQGQVQEAITEYENARVERPDRPEVLYNLGAAFHEKGDFDSSIATNQNALAHLEGTLRPNAYYNMGNSLYRSQQYEAAIDAYKNALIENPADRDAKHNLEMALKHLQQGDSTQQQQQKQDQQQQDSSGQQQQNQQKQDSTGNEQQQDQKQDQQKGQDQQNPNANPQEQQGEPRQPQQGKPLQGMTRADAERLLDAIKQNELALQKKRAQRFSGEKITKDW